MILNKPAIEALKHSRYKVLTDHHALEDLYRQVQMSQTNELRIVLKSDVQGSLGAVTHALEQIQTDEVRFNVLLEGTGEKEMSTTMAFVRMLSTLVKDKAIGAKHQEAVDYFLGQARKYWLRLANRQSQAHLALALQRFGKDQTTPADIMTSLKEFSVTDEEMGMFWRDTEHSWWWYRAPIETQAMMIEAFDEVADDQPAVEECKVWLLKQKQTQDWKTTKATADAIYALLLRGTDLLASDELVEVTLDAVKIEPENVEVDDGLSG